MDMIYCKYCGKWREPHEFRVAVVKDGIMYRRKECNSCVNKRKALRRYNLKEYVWAVKTKNSCCICGENRPECLDFHHRDAEDKEEEIPNAVRKGWSLERLKKEIEKCDIVCANCHRVIHYRGLGKSG